MEFTPRSSEPSRPAVSTVSLDRSITIPANGAPRGGPLDLNTASVEQLNALQGGGMIGRAIVRGRPYSSAEDLLRKKILSRTTYERVRDQVTVR